MIFAVLAVIAIGIAIVIVVNRNDDDEHTQSPGHGRTLWIFEPDEKWVGRQGERIATNII